MPTFDPAALLAESDLELQERLDKLNKERARKGGRLISLVRQVENAAKADDTLPLEEQIENAEKAIAAFDAMLKAVTTKPAPRQDKPGTPSDTSDKRRPDGPRQPKEKTPPAPKAPEPTKTSVGTKFIDWVKRH